MVRDGHASFVRQSMITDFGCCKALRRENEELRELLHQERQKFRRLTLLYQQLLTSFGAHSSPEEISLHPAYSKKASSHHRSGRALNATDVQRNASPTISDISDEESTPAENRVGGFYFVDGNGVVGSPSINLSLSVQRRRAQLVRNSEERQQKVREASRRRAIFAAHRRAAACNVLRGTADFEDVNDLLMVDLTKIEAFPRVKMAHDTRRRIHQCTHYAEQRRKQSQQVEKALSSVLSFCFSQKLNPVERSQSKNKIEARVASARNRLRGRTDLSS